MKNFTACFAMTLSMILAAGCSDDGTPAGDTSIKPDAGDAAVDVITKPDLAAPYTHTLFDKVRINSKGTVNLRKADTTFAFDRGPYAKVTLEVELDTSCFPFEKWKTNPPPTGQNWPADCDAFDRNFEFHLDPPQSATDAPAVELVRSITPFGGPLKYSVDVTDVANGLPGKHTMRVSISTYSDGKGLISGSNGGWWVTAKLKAEPGTPPRKVLAVISLVNGGYKTGDGKQSIPVTVPPGTKTSRVEYRVTGHGSGTADAACVGPAEEFCQRYHKIYVDGTEVKKLAPWRKDCDKLCTLATSGTMQYCKENPCGAISSVKAPRANWCPGSLTPPEIFDFPGLSAPGKHTFEYEIEKVAAKGSWQVSATYFAFGG